MSSEAKKTKTKKKRCGFCNAKLSLVERQLTCRCQKTFCTKHRNDHNCTFDYRQEQTNFLNKSIGECKVVNKQMNKL